MLWAILIAVGLGVWALTQSAALAILTALPFVPPL